MPTYIFVVITAQVPLTLYNIHTLTAAQCLVI